MRRRRVDLAPEERRLIELLGSGWTDDRIARALGISRTTAQRRIGGLVRRLGASSRITVVVRAVQVEAIRCSEIKTWQVERTDHPKTEEQANDTQNK